MKKFKINWIRHGEIENNDHLRIFLNDNLIYITNEYYEKSKQFGGKICLEKKTPLFCSTILRAKQTANALIESNNQFYLVEDHRLNEFFPTELKELHDDQAKEKYGCDYYQIFLNSPYTNKLFESSCKIDHHITTLLSFFEDIIRKYQSDIWLIGHGTLHNIFVTYILKGDYDLIFKNLKLDFLHYSVFEYDTVIKNFSIQTINNTFENKFL